MLGSLLITGSLSPIKLVVGGQQAKLSQNGRIARLHVQDIGLPGPELSFFASISEHFRISRSRIL